eukprot:scpid74681/ scgid6207/ 
MHFQNSFHNASYVSGGVMLDNSMSWPLIATSNSSVPGISLSNSAMFAPSTCTPLAHSLYPNLVQETPVTSSAPYCPDVDACSLSPTPSSPSICDSMTDSPAPSSSSSQSVDVSFRNLMEQRNAVVANLANPQRPEAPSSYDEELKAIKPLLRKVGNFP